MIPCSPLRQAVLTISAVPQSRPERLGLLVSNQLDRDLLPDRSLCDGIPQMRRRIHRLAVIFDNDICALKSRLLRRTVSMTSLTSTPFVGDPELWPTQESNLESHTSQPRTTFPVRTN
jgi:hypothetical protein